VTRPPGRRGAGGRGPTRTGKTRGGGGAKKSSCPLKAIALPVGLARGLLAEWQIRAAVRRG
jgi:hypothetical protein